MGPQTGTGFVKCYPNALGPSITSFMVVSPQDPGKCALCPLPHLLPITRVLRHLSGAVLFCHYHCTVYKSKTHFFFFLISVYSGITPNTTNSFFPCISQEKKKKPKYTPKWPAQHLNHHQITLKFSFKQHSLLGPVSYKQKLNNYDGGKTDPAALSLLEF